MRDDSILLVRLGREGKPHFWIPPGGGMEVGEGAFMCAEREAHEETGLTVRAKRLVYVQELTDDQHHHVKFWVLCSCEDGDPHIDNRVPEEMKDLHEARFVSREELVGLDVVPEILRESFWEDAAAGFPTVKYISIAAVRFS